jgi:hypothetical protein
LVIYPGLQLAPTRAPAVETFNKLGVSDFHRGFWPPTDVCALREHLSKNPKQQRQHQAGEKQAYNAREYEPDGLAAQLETHVAPP